MYTGFKYTLGMTAHIYIAGIPLLAHGLTVKLSPSPCSHSSPAGRIAACLCGIVTSKLHKPCFLRVRCKRFLKVFVSAMPSYTVQAHGGLFYAPLGVKEVTPGVQSWPESEFARYVNHTTILTCIDNLLHAEMVLFSNPITYYDLALT